MLRGLLALTCAVAACASAAYATPVAAAPAPPREVRAYLTSVTPVIVELKRLAERGDRAFAEPDLPGVGKTMQAVGRGWARIARRFAAVSAPRRLAADHRAAARFFAESATQTVAFGVAYEEYEHTHDPAILERLIEAGSRSGEDHRIRRWARMLRVTARAAHVQVPRWVHRFADAKA